MDEGWGSTAGRGGAADGSWRRLARVAAGTCLKPALEGRGTARRGGRGATCGRPTSGLVAG